MGCASRVLVVGGGDRLAEAGRRRIEVLESRWSRFRPDSELNRLAAYSGVPVVVSRDTFMLVERAVRGWEETGGRYDPTVGDAVSAIGYDRSFELLGDRVEDRGPRAAVPRVPGCSGIELDEVVRAVTLPPGVSIDPGGIGKGLAGDMVVAELLDSGASGVLVDIGGDLRVAGEPPDGQAWLIAIEDPRDTARELARVALLDGAVLTTSRAWRSWSAGGREVHHVVDPATGDASGSDVMSATVVAGEGWWGEVLAKAAFVAGAEEGAALVAAAGATGVLVATSGVVHEIEGFGAWSR